MRHQSHHSKRVLEAVRTSDTVRRMMDGYAPALFLQVLAFWFLLRWLLTARLMLYFGRLLVVMMVAGVLGTLDERRYFWASCFAGSTLLAWMLLRRWRSRPLPGRVRLRAASALAWRGRSPDEVATLCERFIGAKVDAAAPAVVSAEPAVQCVLALAEDGMWVVEDQSRLRSPQVGRVLACWDRRGVVAHIEHSRRGECFEFSWPRRGALVRGIMPAGAPADQLAGQLVADELART